MAPLNEWLDGLSTAEDVQRRARFLNILLLGCTILCFVALIGTFFYQFNKILTSQEATTIYWAAFAFLLSAIVVFLINRYWSGKIAAWLFLLLLTLILYFAETPYESVWGPNMVTLVFPVLIAGVILRPATSFIMAGFITAIFYIAAAVNSFEPNFLGAITFFGIAFVAWLSSHTLEYILRQLRQSLTEAITLQEKSQQQQRFLHQVIDINPHFIFVRDQNGRYTLVNQAMADAYGTSVEDLLGKTDADFNPDLVTAGHYRQDDLAVINTQEERFFPEESTTDATGQVRWLQTIKRPLVDHTSAGSLVLGVAIDITERKLAEEQQRLNAQRLQVLHTIDQAILSADSLQNIAKNALSSLCQLIPATYTALVLTFDYETNRAHVLAAVNRFKEPATPPGSIVPIYDSNLLQRLQQGAPVYGADLTQHHELNQTERQIRQSGAISYLMIPMLVEEQLAGVLYLSSEQSHAFAELVFEMGQEVAAQLTIAIRQDQLRRQAAQNMAELERLVDEQAMALRLRNRALESSTVGVSIADARQPDMPLIYVNPAFVEITGYCAEEVIGRNCRFLQGSDREQPGLDEIRTAIREERDCHVTLRNYKKDGTLFYNELAISPVRDARGQVSHFVGIARDITRRQQAEAALQQTEENLRQALADEKELNRLKSRFVSMTSHEFRTPLTTILSSVGLLEHADGTMPPERRLNHYSKVRTAVNHMTELLDDVLFIGKAESDRLEFRPEPMDIKQLCLDITEEMQLAVKGTHQIHFTAQFEQEQVLLDKSLMRQIVTNLLSNAIKYSPQGGTVAFSLSTEANCLVLRVRDEGIGIPARDQARLFEPFHRAHNVVNISGTGLGLAIVYKAVTLHGGVVHFTSEEGEGTEFVVNIPLEK